MAAQLPGDLLALPGSPAYSPFRLVELKDSLNGVLTSNRVTSIRSIYVHYICPQDSAAADTLRDENSRERKSLDQLLVYGDESSELNREAETESLARHVREGQKRESESGGGEKKEKERLLLLLYVSPRRGTISPWSSKATAIAHVCGLGHCVKRIERGVLLSLSFEREYEAGGGGGYPFANSLYDRMTQVRSIFALFFFFFFFGFTLVRK